MSWELKQIQENEEVARNEFWVDLSTCDMFVLQKKMMVSDSEQNQVDELSFRIKACAVLTKEDQKILNPPRRVKTIEMKKDKKQDSIFARLTKRISSTSQQQNQNQPPTINSSPRLHRSETTAFSGLDTLRASSSSLSEGSLSRGNHLTRSKSVGLRDQIMSSNIRGTGGRQEQPKTVQVAIGKSQEEILPYWMHVVFVATQPSSTNPVSQIIHLSQSVHFEKRPEEEVKGGLYAKPKQMNFTLQDHMLESRAHSQHWKCLKPPGKEPSPRPSLNREQEVLAACQARVLRESDGVLFSGILLITSSYLGLLPQKEWKEKRLCDSKTLKLDMKHQGSSSEEDISMTPPPSKKSPNPKDDPLRLLGQLKPDIEKLQNKSGHARMNFPFTSVVAMWRSKCVCDRACRSRPLRVQTMTDQYSIVMTDLSTETRRSILYLIDQIWRWVISLTFQRIKDTVTLNSSNPNESASPLSFSTPSRSPNLSPDTRLSLPFYDIPVDPAESVLETECFLWIDFLPVEGVLSVTQDVLVFQSSSSGSSVGSEPMPTGSTSQHAISSSSPDLVVFSIQLPTITKIQERERSLVASPSQNQFRIFSITTLSKKKGVVLSVNRSRDDVIPLLMQLWAAAVRSPHFFARNSLTMTPPSLISNERGQLPSSKWFGEGPTRVDDRWNQLFETKEAFNPDFWREPFILNLICNGIPDSLRAKVWQITSGSFFHYSRSISNAQRRCLMSSIPRCVSREDLSVSDEVNQEVLITYEDYLNRIRESKKKFLFMEEIERDLHRSLPEHPQFQTIAGIGSLRKVLFAYGARNPDIGYCQSMNIIGALLLCWMDETMAFWTLSVVVERLLVDYYCPSMKGIVIDQMVLQSLVQSRLPEVDRALQDLEINLSVVSMKWFMCLFIQCLPWEICLRVLDCFFAVGVLALFRTALGILDYFQDQLLNFEDPADVLLLLRKCDDVDPTRFFRSVNRFDTVTLDDIEVLRDFHLPQFDELAPQACSSLGQFEEMTVDEENQLLLNIGVSDRRSAPPRNLSGVQKLSAISVPSLESSPCFSSPRPLDTDTSSSPGGSPGQVPQLNFTQLTASDGSNKEPLRAPEGFVSYRTPRIKELSEGGRAARVRSVSTDRGSGPAKKSKQLVELAGHFRHGRVRAIGGEGKGPGESEVNGRHSMYSAMPLKNTLGPASPKRTSTPTSTPRDKLERIRAMSRADQAE